MLAARKRGRPTLVAENGHSDLGQCGRRMDDEKKWFSVGPRKREGRHQICSFVWADNFWIVSHSKENLEQMQRDFLEEADKWDLVPKPASLWWTSTCNSEEKLI